MKSATAVASNLLVPSEALVISDLLGVLQHPIRLMMVCELLEGELYAGELTEKFGTTKGNISQHLTLLLQHGIISRDSRANKNFYRLADPRVAILLRVLKENFCPHGPAPSTKTKPVKLRLAPKPKPSTRKE